MRDATWLFIALPMWFWSATLHSVPGVAVAACLVAGAGIGVVRRQWPLLWFVAPIALGQGYVAVAGLLRGVLHGRDGIGVGLVFVGLQVGAVVLVSRRWCGRWAAAIPLAVFCLAYALFAWFVGGMAFADDWI